MTSLSNIRIAVLATNGFEQSELIEPVKALQGAGATIDIVSPEADSITGWDQKDWGDSVPVDVTLADADASNYHGLVLPGGQMNPDILRMNSDVIDFVKAFASAGMPIGAICHAPWLIVEAGLAQDRHMTSWPSLRTDLKNAGASVQDEEVVVCPHGDFVLITSRKPEDLQAFNTALIEAFTPETVEA